MSSTWSHYFTRQTIQTQYLIFKSFLAAVEGRQKILYSSATNKQNPMSCNKQKKCEIIKQSHRQQSNTDMNQLMFPACNVINYSSLFLGVCHCHFQHTYITRCSSILMSGPMSICGSLVLQVHSKSKQAQVSGGKKSTVPSLMHTALKSSQGNMHEYNFLPHAPPQISYRGPPSLSSLFC